MRPNPLIVNELKRYDKHLSIKWNNKDNYWEIWRKCLGGDKLVTPVCPNIYNRNDQPFVFAPLDRRIVAWIYNADTWRVGRKKFLKSWDHRFWEILREKKKKKSQFFREMALDNYAYMNDVPRSHRASLNSDKFRHYDIDRKYKYIPKRPNISRGRNIFKYNPFPASGLRPARTVNKDVLARGIVKK